MIRAFATLGGGGERGLVALLVFKTSGTDTRRPVGSIPATSAIRPMGESRTREHGREDAEVAERLDRDQAATLDAVQGGRTRGASRCVARRSDHEDPDLGGNDLFQVPTEVDAK